MNALLSWLATPEWALIVETLLHSLWEGALLAVGLLLIFRFIAQPAARYRLSLLALFGLVAACVVTWSVLQEKKVTQAEDSGFEDSAIAGKNSISPAISPATPASSLDSAVVETRQNNSGSARAPQDLKVSINWSAWLAAVWLLGVLGMLIRSGAQVAGAGRLRHSCQPLEDGPVKELLVQIQEALDMVRTVRVVVTDQLVSPAVVGVLVPVLILPLSLMTTLSPEQLRFILLHELAHIRRADYLVNVFQLLVEALLFFNPAVWWITRQIRLEREACCDAMAVALSGAPADYVRTLLQVAEAYTPAGSAAMAFGGTREPSSLAERIQRLLTPGHCPRLRLTWRAMLISLVLGGGLLVLSALGTRIAVAAVLTPQQRMARIEQTLAEHGEDILSADNDLATNKVIYSGRVRMEDGSPLPKNLWIYSHLVYARNSSFGTSDLMKRDGTFSGSSAHGRLTLTANVPGYAPCVVGPISLGRTNIVDGIELVLRRGFATTIQMNDADSGAPLANALVTVQFKTPDGNAPDRQLTTDFQGQAVLTNCANLPLDLTGTAAGYEVAQETFDSLSAGETLRLSTHHGAITKGMVFDKVSGQPLAGAVIQVLREQGTRENGYDWTYQPFQLATSDVAGHFATSQLRRDCRYTLGISLPGRESVMFRDVQAGDTNLVARLGPELAVHGRVLGNVRPAMDQYDRPEVRFTITDRVQNSSYQNLARAQLTNGVIYFQFTNRVAGPVELQVGEVRQTRTVDAPIADWVVELTNATAKLVPPKMREVVVRLKSASGVSPRGTINLLVPSDPNHLQASYYEKKAALENGEVRLSLPVGASIQYSPDKTTVGYWFESGFNWTNVVAGEGPMVIEVPVIPAGIITARARNADGSPAGGLMFSIQVVKPSPALENKNASVEGQGDGYSGTGPRQYVSPPLPLGGTYQILGWRGNSFCASSPVTLTESAPDQSVELQFGAGRVLTGRLLDPAGQPVRGASITGNADFKGHSFGMKEVFTDDHGNFQQTDCSPEVMDYSLVVSQPGFMAERVNVNFNHLPLTVQLKPGLKLTGRVVEAATGFTIANVEVRTWQDGGNSPMITTHTDADGNYEFTTLGKGTYRIYVDGANFTMNYDNEFKAGTVTNLLLKVTPYQGSQLTINRPKK